MRLVPFESVTPAAPAALAREGHDRVFATSVVDLSAQDWQDFRISQPRLPETQSGPQSAEELRAVGRWGERFVFAYLQRVSQQVADGALIRWVNEERESGLCYDIRVEDGAGKTKAYIEVKATRKVGRHFCEVGQSEWDFAREHGETYAIYRVQGVGRSDVSLAVIPDPHRQWRDRRIGVWLTL